MMSNKLYHTGRKLVDGFAHWMYDLDIVYHSPLPLGAKIFAPNHPTTTDPFLITKLIETPISIMIHDTLFKVPVFGRYLQAAGHIRVVSGNGMAVLSAAMRKLEADIPVAIFPEGGISPRDGSLLAGHSGMARLALATGAPIIPVGIALDRSQIRCIETTVDGKAEVARWYAKGPYAITVGKPMVFNGDANNWNYVNAVTAQIMQNITALAWESTQRLPVAESKRKEMVNVSPEGHWLVI
ncbi:MAG: lysophospholipid acyltransferase family protein [Chloroflexota bacterium]|nr:lysophospholipid acyltransferase family protein [Chloroflexota bacterium]